MAHRGRQPQDVRGGRPQGDVLTSLTTQAPEKLAASIRIYRAALEEAGFDPATRTVTMMLHAHVGETDAEAFAVAGRALERYFDSHTELRQQVASSLQIAFATDADGRAELIRTATQRVMEGRSLIGSVETCRRRLEFFASLGVDEVACLIDFGIDTDATLAALPGLARLVGGRALQAEAVRARLRQVLPQHMIPARFIPVAKIPLTANGKIDRAALAAAAAGQSSAATTPTAEPEPAAAPPASGTEIAVHRIWSELMNVKRLGVRDNFFDVGGYSLLIPRVMAQIRAQLRVDIPLKTFLRGPTIAELAASIDAARGERQASADGAAAARGRDLTVLLNRGSTDPLVLVHPVGGGLACYDALLSQLDPNTTVHGVLSAPADSVDAGHTLAALAALYVDSLLRAIPDGRCHLAGWSFGGVLAHAMAVRLASRGHDVLGLTLIDAFPSASSEVLGEEELRIRYAAYLRNEAQHRGALPADADERQFLTFMRNHRALRLHAPALYASPAQLFVAASGPDRAGDPIALWQPAGLADLRIERVAADHYAILQPPYVEGIAGYLDAAVARAQAQRRVTAA